MATYYADYDNGSNDNPGSETQPWKTLVYSVLQLSAGDTLYCRGVTFYEANLVNCTPSGTEENPITVTNYAGEQPVIDLAGIGAGAWGDSFKVDGAWWRFIGLEFRNAGSCNVSVYGADAYFEGCVSHDSGLTGFMQKTGGVRGIYKKCVSYNHFNPAEPNHSDGFSVEHNSNADYCEYDQCIAHHCSDQGFDFCGGSGCEATRCVAYDIDYSGGDCGGFKIGCPESGSGGKPGNTLDRCLAWRCGKVHHSGTPAGIAGCDAYNYTATNCTVYDCYYGYVGWSDGDATGHLRNCGAYGCVVNTQFFEGQTPEQITCSWQLGSNDPDFIGVDDNDWGDFLSIQASGSWDDNGTDYGYGNDVGALQVGQTLAGLMGTNPPGGDGWKFGTSSAQHNTLDQCEVYNCGDDGIDCVSSLNQTIKRCVVHNIHQGGTKNGFKLGPGGGNRAEQCLAWDCGSAGFADYGGDGNEVVNCTAYDCDGYAFSIEGDNGYWYNNGAYGNTHNYGNWGSGNTLNGNSWQLDPASPDPKWLGTDDSNWDDFLAITSNSPWKDAGGSYGIFDDIGALEYGTTLNEMMGRGAALPEFTHPPHNHFEDDDHCIAVFRVENGALTVDSKGGNTLTNDGVTSNTTTFKEGDASAEFDGASNLRVADSDLDSDFPLKSGDTTKTLTWCGWVQPNTLSGYMGLMAKYGYVGVEGNKRSLGFCIPDNKFRILFGHNNGESYEAKDHGGTLVAGRWYWWGLDYGGDGTKAFHLHVFDEFNNTTLGTDLDDTITNNLNVEDATFHIGALQDGSSEFDGKQDELVVFDVVKSLTDKTKIRRKVYGCFEGNVGKIQNPHKIGQVVGLNIKSYNGVPTAEPPPPEPDVIVAANDSSSADKARADYVCDGTADEVEVQDAVDDLGTSGGWVALCAGTYNFADEVLIDEDDIKVAGEGTQAAHLKRGGTADRLFMVQLCDNCTITNMELESVNSDTECLVRFEGSTNCYATYCKVHGCYRGIGARSHVGSSTKASGIHITDNELYDIDYCATGVKCGCEYIYIEDNEIHDGNGGNPCYAVATGSIGEWDSNNPIVEWLYIKNNWIYNWDGNKPIDVHGGNHIVVENNQIDDTTNASSAIYLHCPVQASNPGALSDWRIIDNYIDGVDNSAGSSRGIWVEAEFDIVVTGLEVDGNTVKDFPWRGIWCSCSSAGGTDQELHDVDITDNVVDTYTGIYSTSCAIRLACADGYTADTFNILRNTIHGTGSPQNLDYGIMVNRVDDGLIDDNEITGYFDEAEISVTNSNNVVVDP